ncbi:cysteine desulfurase family protein [Rhinopithecimicrobium faecis]|uniref:cysteine desulfurase family protein n=1 Tax=Rhinopithecimicrobium faecis TaxID=2820698 RepID=UPI003365A836
MQKYIYLDNNSTTAVRHEVWETMSPYFQEYYGNPASLQHALGRQAAAALLQARTDIAAVLHCQKQEIFFNSGATESINTVLKGVFQRYALKGKHIIVSTTEHKAVLNCCEELQKLGAEISYLPVDEQGAISLSLLAATIRKDTILVCLMAANNETGALHPIQEIAALCQAKDCLYFCDATQYIGKLPLFLEHIPIDILCLSAHKFHGPKGVGILYIRRKSKPIQVHPLLHGGGQELNFRGGTQNLPLIVGMAKALTLAAEEGYNSTYIRELRDYFEQEICARIPASHIISQDVPRLPNTSMLVVEHLLATEIMSQLPHIALAAGSACSSASRAPSHVLLAQGMTIEKAKASLRVSFSMLNTADEVATLLALLPNVVERLRAQSPIWQLVQAGIIR